MKKKLHTHPGIPGTGNKFYFLEMLLFLILAIICMIVVFHVIITAAHSSMKDIPVKITHGIS